MRILELVAIFNEIGLLLELKGENPFKTRAYYNAARTLENFHGELERLIVEDRLQELSGFGEALIKKVKEWYSTGNIDYYLNLKNSIPPGLFEILKIPGLGAKKVNVLYSQLGLTNLDQLEEACKKNLLVNLPGFGVKTQLKIETGILFVKEHRGQFLWMEVWPQAQELKEILLTYPEVSRVEIAGSLRRFKEVVKDLDLVVATAKPAEVIRFFIHLPQVAQIISSGSTKGSVILRSGINADLRAVQPEEFPHALQHFTGSKEHNTALRHLAKTFSYKVNEYGIYREKNDELIFCQNETDIYKELGLQYIPPELREDLGEIEAAKNYNLPKLIKSEDIRGIFHVHTTGSDGVNTLEEMVEATISKGYSYLGIADHSQTAVYARGLTLERLERQFEMIDTLNQRYPGFRIFKGIEADILPDGSLDYEDMILQKFDFVIGSVHSSFKMSREMMTQRILKALDHPLLTILGHPTGRILIQRPAYDIDIDAIIERAIQKGVIMEFNANPYRLDLDWRWCRRVKEKGGLISINPDAHSIGEIDLARTGLAVARKGWLEATNIFNTWNVIKIEEYFKKRKAGNFI